MRRIIINKRSVHIYIQKIVKYQIFLSLTLTIAPSLTLFSGHPSSTVVSGLKIICIFLHLHFYLVGTNVQEELLHYPLRRHWHSRDRRGQNIKVLRLSFM